MKKLFCFLSLFLIACQSLSSTKNTCDSYPENFGAIANDSVDDTKFIQAALDSLGSRKTLCFKEGTYWVDAAISLKPKSHTRIKMNDNTVLRAIPNNLPLHSVIKISGQKNVEVIGGEIIGERNEHAGKDGEWGMGIMVLGSSDVLLKNVKIRDFWGDGIYIGRGETASRDVSEDVEMAHIRAINNRRQGLSIISGRRILVRDSHFYDTNGIPPAAGIDVEPNEPGDILEKIEIRNIRTRNNAYGILFFLDNLDWTNNSSIILSNHEDEGSKRGIVISAPATNGVLTISEGDWAKSLKLGKVVRSCKFQVNAKSSTDEFSALNQCKE